MQQELANETKTALEFLSHLWVIDVLYIDDLLESLLEVAFFFLGDLRVSC